MLNRHHPDRPIDTGVWAAENFEEYRFGQLAEMPSCDTLSVKGPEGEPFLSGRDA